jgi:hypothetical protein
MLLKIIFIKNMLLNWAVVVHNINFNSVATSWITYSNIQAGWQFLKKIIFGPPITNKNDENIF